jgi:Tfp pilus assembly protein PilO
LFAYYSNKQSTTKLTSFYSTYGRKAVLPVDDLTQNEKTMQDRIAKMLDKLPHDRELTKKRIDQQQIKQKSYHDKQIKF